ncbi:cytochrome P450 [Sinosporangium siamense]|uniref:Cytochrome P450 n=1 Tax=Sinosporangium siamense TaxID=1367973 RepID=A0A919RDF8_9ACTN|nr:cytochrome P450 [Sinosporangium siamense]GII91858.1 cytochrome P450 [Sinosporangium siamense]
MQIAGERRDAGAFPMPRTCPYHPPPGYAGLRERGPVSRVTLADGRPAWVVTGYEEVRRLFADHRVSSDRADPNYPRFRPGPPSARPDPRAVRASRTFVEMDPPEHGHHRRMVTHAFTLRRVRAMRPAVSRAAGELLDRMAELGSPADLVRAYAVPLPALTMCDLFGVPGEDRGFFVEQTGWAALDRRAAGRARRELGAYFGELARARERRPGRDLLSTLVVRHVRAGELTGQELSNMVVMMVVAGHETTASMIALGALTLLEHPGQLALLAEDPSLVPRAVDELLRFLTVVDTFPRVAKADIDLGDVRIRAGDAVILLTAAANRDPSVFPDPDTLDVRRAARPHLSFAYGVHQCLGQNLARQELEIAFSALFTRFPTLRGAAPLGDIPVNEAVGVQGVGALPVQW